MAARGLNQPLTIEKRRMRNNDGVMEVEHYKNYIHLKFGMGAGLMLPNTPENMQRITVLLNGFVVDTVFSSKHPVTGREIMYQCDNPYRAPTISSMFVAPGEILDNEQDAKAYWEEIKPNKEEEEGDEA